MPRDIKFHRQFDPAAADEIRNLFAPLERAFPNAATILVGVDEQLIASSMSDDLNLLEATQWAFHLANQAVKIFPESTRGYQESILVKSGESTVFIKKFDFGIIAVFVKGSVNPAFLEELL